MAGQVPRCRLRHPRRRRRPALPAPRERAGPVAGGRAGVRVVLDAQRLDHHRRREDEQVAGQLAAGPQRARAGAGRSSCATTWSAAHYRSHVEFSFEALRRGGGRLPADRELPRAGRRGPRRGAPRAGCLRRLRRRDGRRPRHAGRRRGRSSTPCARATGCVAGGASAALRGNAAAVRAMLGVLGLDPFDPHWAPDAATATCTTSSTRWSEACSSSAPRRAPPRTSPPPTRSATRSRRPASRSRTLPTARGGASDARDDSYQGQALTAGAAARSRRPARATRLPGRADGCKRRGSRARARRRRPRTGPYHKAYKNRQRTDKARDRRREPGARRARAERRRVDRRAQQRRRGAARRTAR